VGGYHLALRKSVPWTRSVENCRWAFAGTDPGNGRVQVGSFSASDGAAVPYRLWLAKKPHALVLLLHGCCDYSGAFDDIAPKLAARGQSCMAYDQRGFGATASRGNWTSKDRIVADVRDAIIFFRHRTNGELPLFIVGESMGGSVAVHTAALSSDLGIRGLVLIAPGALDSAFRNALFGWLMRLLTVFAGRSEIVVERNDVGELSASAAIRLLGDPMVMQSIRAELLAGVIAMGHAAVSAATQVHIPTLTIVAGKDDLLRSACVRQLHENLRGPKILAAAKNAPHLLLHWQRGEIALRYLRRWIDHRLHDSTSPSHFAPGHYSLAE
jgi:acylglycerol lipase